MDCLNRKMLSSRIHFGGVLTISALFAFGVIGLSSTLAQGTTTEIGADGQVTTTTEQPAANLPDAAELFAKHVKAIGGEKAIRKHKSAVSKATFNMPAMGITADMTISTAAPDKMYLDMTIPGMGSMQQGYDGKIAWAIDPMSGARIMEGDQLKQVKMQSDFYADLHYSKQYKEMQTMEKTVFADRPSYRVHTVTEFGQDSDVYFDVETGLINGMESTSDSQMGPMKTTTTLADYKDFGGIKKATTTKVSAFGQEQLLTLKSVEFDTVDMSVFDLPEEIKTMSAEQAKNKEAAEDKDGDDEGNEHADGEQDDDEGGEHAEHGDKDDDGGEHAEHDDDDDDDDGGGH